MGGGGQVEMKVGQTRKGFNSECEEMPLEGSSAGDHRDNLLGERIRTLPLGG